MNKFTISFFLGGGGVGGVWGNYLRLGACQFCTKCSHTFSVSSISISKTKKKEHCSNFIPINHISFFGGAGGEKGVEPRLGTY